MTSPSEFQKAAAFLTSARGTYIVSQALELAIREIESRPQMEQEPSNVLDMRYLRQSIFDMPCSVGKLTILADGQTLDLEAMGRGPDGTETS